MSAIISCEAAGAVTILTDGAAYDPDHRLVSIGRKVEISRQPPVVVATRGHMAFGDYVAKGIVKLVTDKGFDAAMASLDDWMDHFAPRDDRHDRIEVLVAGVSEEHGPRHLVFTNVQCRGTGAFEPLKLIHPGHSHYGIASDGRLDGIAEIGIRKPLPGEHPYEYFSTFGARIMEFYRRIPIRSFADPEKDPAHIIGGQVDLTVLTANDVFTATIHRWPDKIGEKIDPFAQIGNVTPLGNRHARRAARKAA